MAGILKLHHVNSFQEFKQKLIYENPNLQEWLVSVETELETFPRMLKNKKENIGNPLFFWDENQQTLPTLAELARKCLCILPSSASEQVISF